MRTSKDELNKDGSILNGFDYNLQVWVVNGICQNVGPGKNYAGKPVNTITGHEVRTNKGALINKARGES